MPMHAHLSLAAAGVALVLTGCGNDPEGAPRPAPDKTTQLQDAGRRPMSAHYVGKSEWGRGGGGDVVTAGERIRVSGVSRTTTHPRSTTGCTRIECWSTSGLVLQVGKGLQADEVTMNPPIDTDTFSAECQRTRR